MSINPLQARRVRVTVDVQRSDAHGNPTDFNFVFTEHRMRLSAQLGGGQFGNAQVRIAGVPLEAMNRIARLQVEPNALTSTDKVSIDVWTGKDFQPWFSGMIVWSAVEITPPEAWLVIEANAAGALFNVPDAPAYSNPTPVALSAVLTKLAAYGGMTAELSPTATDYQCVNLHLSGSPLQQIGALISQFPDLTWDVRLQRVVVYPAAQALDDEPAIVSVQSGLVGYPAYNTTGLTFRTLFDNRLTLGRALDIKTSLEFVTRSVWTCAVIRHNLEPNVPGGAWFSDVAANYYRPKAQNATQ